MRLKVSNVCQLLDKSKYPETQTKQGITYTNDGNGIITINGTNTASDLCVFILNVMGGKPGHKYMQLGATDDGQWNTYGLECKWVDGDDVGHGFTMTNGIMSIPSDVIVRDIYVSVVVHQGYTVSNKTFKPQLFDLTEMFGVGNEPTTVEQFRQDFPDEMYEYSPVCWKKFRRLKYIANKEPVQLLDKSKFKAATSKNVTATPDITNGMWTISGAATASEYLPIGVYYPGIDFNIGDKLFLRHSNIDNSVYFPYAGYYDKDNKYLGEQDGTGIFSVTNPETAYIACYFTTRTTGNINVTTQVQLFNLTRMYGKGNEPTANEFFAQYPGYDYPVNKYNYLTLNRGKYIANKEPVQLLDKSKFPATQTNKGVTFTNNGDGTITVNGTATGSGNAFTLQWVDLHKDHIYFVWTNQAGSYDDIIFACNDLGDNSKLEGNIFRSTVEGESLIYFWVRSGTTIDNRVYKPQLFDLTAMYGEGNEPTTVAQFRADYPNELYDYNPYNAITFR